MPAQSALEFVNAAALPGAQKTAPWVLGPVCRQILGRAAALGVDLAGKTVALDHDSVRHILTRHGGVQERRRGQEPIEADDMAHFLAIFNGATLKTGIPPVAKDGALLLAGEAAVAGWQYGFVVKVRRKHVVVHTLFKKQHPQKSPPATCTCLSSPMA